MQAYFTKPLRVYIRPLEPATSSSGSIPEYTPRVLSDPPREELDESCCACMHTQ